MLKAHKRSTRRLSSGGRSASPVPRRSERRSETGLCASNTAKPPSQEAGTASKLGAGQSKSGEEGGVSAGSKPGWQEGDAMASPSELGDGTSGEGAAAPMTDAQQPVESGSSSQPVEELTVGNLLSDWFQKLFSPQEGEGGDGVGTSQGVQPAPASEDINGVNPADEGKDRTAGNTHIAEDQASGEPHTAGCGAEGNNKGKGEDADRGVGAPSFLGLFSRSNSVKEKEKKEKEAAAAAAAAAKSGSGREEQHGGAATASAADNPAADTDQGAGSSGGGGTTNSSSSPQRTETALSGESDDDGEEVNLYTVGSHQGARPSIDDFSSLRVLGKGSYGKVVLVRRKSTGVLYAMKILKKGDVVRKRQVERTKIERRVLGNVEHPFLMRLHYAFQTDKKLYLVLDYCPGGELFFHLSRYKRFPEGVVRFYSAELVLALKHLHDNNIIYRDIKPENILLDAQGHIKLGDFGLAKDNVTDSATGAQSVCGTPEYMAPEVINKAGHGMAVDWWGLGMLMYEMLTGLPPWYTKDRQKLFERLRGAPLVIPKTVSAPSASIISGLLTRSPSKRLGALGATQVMNHDFFRSLDWAALLAKKIPAPLNPCRNQSAGSESTHNFDPQFTRLPIDTMAAGGSLVSPGPNGHFDGFTFEIHGLHQDGRGQT